MGYLFTLKSLRIIDDNVELSIDNNYNLENKKILLPVAGFDLNKVCEKLSIATGDYLAQPYLKGDETIDYSQPIEYEIINTKNRVDVTPIFQLQSNNLNEFVYRLLVFKYSTIKIADSLYNGLSCKDLKISRKGYLRQLYNEYSFIKKKYFDKDYYKNNSFKNLNKEVVRLLYKYLFK